MHDFFLQYGLFLAKTVTALAALVILVVFIASAIRQSRRGHADRLEVKSLNDRLEHAVDVMNDALLNDAEHKRYVKQRKAEDKAREKAQNKSSAKVGTESKARVFVLDFDGDIEASQVESLREEVSAIVQVARPGDSVLLRLESGGGVVHGYGLAASQLRRLRSRDIGLTIAIDKVAASGGYMMASVANHLIAAPFAIVGSIGVIGQLPNFNRLLRDNKIDYEMHTAGEFKRTLTVFGENTDAAREKFREELDQTHGLFKRFVAENRPKLALERVATGEYWYGTQALELALVDELKTSDDFLLEQAAAKDVYEIHYRPPRDLRRMLLGSLGRIFGSGLFAARGLPSSASREMLKMP